MEASQILLRLFEHTGSHFPVACHGWIRVCRIHIIARRLYLPSLQEHISEKIEVFSGEERYQRRVRNQRLLKRPLPGAPALVTNRRRILLERFEARILAQRVPVR